MLVMAKEYFTPDTAEKASKQLGGVEPEVGSGIPAECCVEHGEHFGGAGEDCMECYGCVERVVHHCSGEPAVAVRLPQH